MQQLLYGGFELEKLQSLSDGVVRPTKELTGDHNRQQSANPPPNAMTQGFSLSVEMDWAADKLKVSPLF